MARNRRLLLAFLGLLLLILSLCFLVYAFWPLGLLTEQVELAPTLFAPP